ncbi:hypothetical protein AB1Y20_021212 [Prymnesium parvum]|uniref:G-protein coupled receptors family 1 profile domain-containing protein n=1 Tax=Prymnesium parvum TaxID=97485 RepID=A0AB34JIX6_PRYPA
MVDTGPIGLSSEGYWNVALVFSILEFVLVLLFVLVAQTACSLVLRYSNRRMPKLCTMRVTLCMLTTLWMGSLLMATPAPWRLLRFAFRLSVEALSDACWIQLVICHGLVEPSLLTLIMLLFRAKAASSSVWRPGRLLRNTAIVGGVFTAVCVVVQKYGGQENTIFFRPEPELSHNATGEYIAADRFPPTARHPWWRNEGCADTNASAVGSALFLAPFLFYWTVACVRLRRLLINDQLVRRLVAVQLTFTLVPTLILILRIVLMQFPSHWASTRRLMRDGELLLALIGSTACVRALVSRPLLEGHNESADLPNKSEKSMASPRRLLLTRCQATTTRPTISVAVDVSADSFDEGSRQLPEAAPTMDLSTNKSWERSRSRYTDASTVSALSAASPGDVSLDLHSPMKQASAGDREARSLSDDAADDCSNDTGPPPPSNANWRL